MFDQNRVRSAMPATRDSSPALDASLLSRSGERDLAEARHALWESEERLSLALEAGRMGTWEWDTRRDLMVWSPGLEALHGLESGTFGGRFEDFRRDIHPEDHDRVLEAIRATVASGKPYEIEYRICVSEGREVWLEARGRVFRGTDGTPERVIGLCMDITRRKRAELAFEESVARKDEFLAMLGHELRNPLAPILNCIHLMRQPNATPEQSEQAWQMMERQVKHLSRLVDGLLDVSDATNGKISLWKARIDLGEIVRQVLADYHGLLETKRFTVATSFPSDPLVIDGDATRLAQALGNLLDNAVKFSESGATLTVTVRREPGGAFVSIRDTGIGIAADVLPRVFEPFSQAEAGLDRSRGGLGLGLAMVKAIVDMHGGTVEAHSRGINQGSEFVLHLPPSTVPESSADARTAAISEPLRILLVEDHPDAAASMRMMLELENHSVEIASNGGASIALARKFTPDLVLCDIGLPSPWNGYAVARAFRADPALRAIPLVALTGYGQAADRERSRAAGFDVHLTKPVQYESLRRVFTSLRTRTANGS